MFVDTIDDISKYIDENVVIKITLKDETSVIGTVYTRSDDIYLSDDDDDYESGFYIRDIKTKKLIEVPDRFIDKYELVGDK